MSSFQTLGDASIDCTGLAYANGILKPSFTDKGGNTKAYPYKGFMATADGTVVIKPFYNEANNTLPVTVVAGEVIGYLFDHVVEAGTTVPLADLYLIPDLGRIYGQGV